MRASSVVAKPVRWLWHPFIPFGKISLLAGQMGQAKSTFTGGWLVAGTTRGDLHAGAGSAIVLNGEDDPEDTIRPRLEAAGADLDRVWIDPAVTLDVVALARVCDRELPNVRLITIDPVSAFMGNANPWKTTDVRKVFEPLRVFAKDRGIAVVVVQHLNRRDSDDPLDRIADSQGLAQLARSVMVWGPDPADDDDTGARKVLARAKSNLAPPGPGAAFTIEVRAITGGISAPALVHHGASVATAFDVVADHDTRTKVREAEDWLRDVLSDGPVPAKDIKARAKRDGIADKTLRNAAKRIDAESVQERSEDGRRVTGWVWRFKPSTKTASYGIDLDHVDHLDHLDLLDGQGGLDALDGVEGSNGARVHPLPLTVAPSRPRGAYDDDDETAA